MSRYLGDTFFGRPKIFRYSAVIRAIWHLFWALLDAGWLRLVLLFRRMRRKQIPPPQGSQEAPALPFPNQGGPRSPIYFQALPAHNGDALLIEYTGTDDLPHRIWVDGGLVKSYESHGKAILQALQQQNEAIDLMIVTHIDQDHIGGILAFMKDSKMRKDLVQHVWFNSSRLLSQHFRTTPQKSREVGLAPNQGATRSLDQGDRLEDELMERDIWHDHLISRLQRYELFGAGITILSPDEEGLARLNREWQDELDPGQTSRGWGMTDHQDSIERLAKKKEDEDDAIPNGSSIAFLYEYQGKRILLTGDSHPSVVIRSLRELGYSREKPIALDCMKLSHHGSKGSTTYELLSLVNCYQFVVSTDGSRHHLPHKEALSRIIMDPTRDFNRQLIFIFNHDTPLLRGIFSMDDQQKYNFTCKFPGRGNKGILMEF